MFKESTTTLLCTFTSEAALEQTVKTISQTYKIAFGKIYILENTDNPNMLCCTYNVFTDETVLLSIPDSTISLHRKKISNSLYTINALNLLVAELNGGKVDRNFPIPWENYRNSILVTAYGALKMIPTKIRDIVDVIPRE